MRRSEITPELIELSKRAKELGFPQVMEKGDWFLIQDNDYKSGYSSPKLCEFFENNPNNVLILSFSRCLEWLWERGWKIITSGYPEYTRVTVGRKDGSINPEITKIAKTHHEAIAKAVVKILEGEG